MPDSSPFDGHPASGGQACGVCGRVLDFVEGYGWRHSSVPDPEAGDHPAVPVPLDQIRVRGRCDLCFAEPVTAVLYTAPITVVGVTGAGQVDPLSADDGEWACCAVCARLIRKDRWDQLLDRCVGAVAAANATPVTSQMRSILGDLHAQLRRTRTGPPVPTDVR